MTIPKPIQEVREWVEERTGLEATLHHLLYEQIPGSSGWHQVFGSVALFCFLLQVFTGILLAMNYAPTPGEAHSSLRYIINEVTSGRLVRGLHHFGASGMIIIVVLHMLQVYLWGAYKKPREATWMVGVVLLLLTLGFGLTGYLLPWDNRAYWGTVVTTQIAALTPGMGDLILRMLGSEGGQIGAVTFARFYSAHVLVLPLVTFAMVGLHVVLVRKHGVAPAAVETKPPKSFYPGQVFKDTVAIFVVFAALFLLASLVKVPLGKVADPNDTSYIPRPEWYFLFLFELLKYFEGKLEVIGAIILPGVFVGLLFLTPFLDRGKAIALKQRTYAFSLVALLGLGWAALTFAAMKATPESLPWKRLTPEQMAAIGTFRKANCGQCHGTQPGQNGAGPNFSLSVVHKDQAWQLAHFKQHLPGGVSFSTLQWKQLSNFLIEIDDENADALAKAPVDLVAGATLYQKTGCFACHVINGGGMRNGPVLNGVGRRRNAKWIEDHFRDPQSLSLGSTMPEYDFAPNEMKVMVAYMQSLTD